MNAVHIADFDVDLAFTERARKLIERDIYSRFAYRGRFVSLVGDSAGIQYLQRQAHIDAVVQVEAGRSVTFEEKIVRRKYNAFAVETHSNVEQGKPGWIYTSTADRLLYAFGIPDGLGVWLLPLAELREWFAPREQDYAFSDTPNGWGGEVIYHIRCRIVPIADVGCPKRTLTLKW